MWQQMLELRMGRTPLAQTPSLLLGLPLAPLPKHHAGSQAGDPVVLAQDVLVSSGLGGQGWPRSIGLGRKKINSGAWLGRKMGSREHCLKQRHLQPYPQNTCS